VPYTGCFKDDTYHCGTTAVTNDQDKGVAYIFKAIESTNTYGVSMADENIAW
jgi:hypothetical protein